MKAVREASTLADDVFEAMRADILACRLQPGAKLKIGDLCLRFEVSLGAVREALSRLAAERLVQSRAQRGYSVAPVSVDDLRDLTTARIEVEAACLKHAIAAGGVEWETNIVAAMHRLSRTPVCDANGSADPAAISETWLDAHAAYHEALVGACDSLHLLRIRKHLYQQGERYRLLAISLGRDMRSIDAEHRRIARAVLRRNVAAAVAAMSGHVSRSADIITGALSGLTPIPAQARPNRRREAHREA